jgi:septal ring-binding cell division protein DamX
MSSSGRLSHSHLNFDASNTGPGSIKFVDTPKGLRENSQNMKNSASHGGKDDIYKYYQQDAEKRRLRNQRQNSHSALTAKNQPVKILEPQAIKNSQFRSDSLSGARDLRHNSNLNGYNFNATVGKFGNFSNI